SGRYSKQAPPASQPSPGATGAGIPSTRLREQSRARSSRGLAFWGEIDARAAGRLERRRLGLRDDDPGVRARTPRGTSGAAVMKQATATKRLVPIVYRLDICKAMREACRMERFADELQAAMAGAGLTAAQVAQRSGLTESAISLLRSGRREPTYRTVKALAAVLPTLAGQDAERVRMDSIESAIAAIRDGQMVIVLDDEDRENEGDLVMAAVKVTPEAINFMRKEAGGLICVPMTSERLDELQIPNMVNDNTAPLGTAFSVSVEARGRVTTGISAHDRANTIKALVDPNCGPADFLRPGHTFPLRAREGGVLVRAGQTEAAVDLARLAGLYPAG